MIVISIAGHFGDAIRLDHGRELFQCLAGGDCGFRFVGEDVDQAVLELLEKDGAGYQRDVTGKSKLQDRPRCSAGRRNRRDQDVSVEYDRGS